MVYNSDIFYRDFAKIFAVEITWGEYSHQKKVNASQIFSSKNIIPFVVRISLVLSFSTVFFLFFTERLLAPFLSNSQYFDLKFWCIPLETTQDLLELVFLEAFAHSIFFPNVHDQGINFRRKSVLPIFFPEQKSSCSVLSSQENMSLPRYCRKDHLFKHSLHLFLRDTIRTKFTQQFRLFHTYGDVYAPLITFMGTWIWERECLLSLSFIFRTLTRTLQIQNEGQKSTQRISVFLVNPYPSPFNTTKRRQRRDKSSLAPLPHPITPRVFTSRVLTWSVSRSLQNSN